MLPLRKHAFKLRGLNNVYAIITCKNEVRKLHPSIETYTRSPFTQILHECQPLYVQ